MEGREMTRQARKLEKARTEALSSITGDRVRVELMAQRPRTDDDKLDTTLLQIVLANFTELEAKAKDAATEDDLKDLIADGEQQGQFAAYFCPINEVYDAGILAIDTIEGWGIPKSSPKRLLGLSENKLKNAASDPYSARGALHSIYKEMDEWGDFIDDYEEVMDTYMNWLFWFSVGMLLASIAALYLAPNFPFLIFLALLLAGATGSCISVMGKMPAVEASLSGELDAYRRRVLTRICVGITASIIGCGLLAWGVLPISIQGQTFSDALTVSSAASPTGNAIIKALIIITVPMLLGFSERALTTFENRILGELHSSPKKR
jgi:hypothetical protein